MGRFDRKNDTSKEIREDHERSHQDNGDSMVKSMARKKTFNRLGNLTHRWKETTWI